MLFSIDYCKLLEVNISNVKLIANRQENVYVINMLNMKSQNVKCLVTVNFMDNSWLWHIKLGHTCMDTFSKLQRNDSTWSSKIVLHLENKLDVLLSLKTLFPPLDH